MIKRAVRFDVGGIGRATRTQQGFLRIPGNVTRVGVLDYTRADGSTFRELRHPDEVFRDDSIQSMSFAPVTDRHPAELVTPKNVRDLQVGIVTNVGRNDRFVRSDLIVQDERMITKVNRGDARELSAGYTCRIDETAGEFNGERYDGIQRGIVYNHVALGPRDWGRAGPEVALHIDGMSDDLRNALGVERFDEQLADLLALHPEAVLPLPKTDGPSEPPRKEPPVSMKTIRIDGIDYEVAAVAHPHIDKYINKLAGALGVETKRADKAEGERDAAQTELVDVKKKLDAAADPAKVQAAVTARVDLEKRSRKVLGNEAKFDGKEDRLIKVEVIQSQVENFDGKDRSDDYINARYDAIVEAAPERRDGRDGVRKAIAGTPGGDPRPPKRKDGNDDPDDVTRIDSADGMRKRAERIANERGRQPLPSQVKHGTA